MAVGQNSGIIPVVHIDTHPLTWLWDGLFNPCKQKTEPHHLCQHVILTLATFSSDHLVLSFINLHHVVFFFFVNPKKHRKKHKTSRTTGFHRLSPAAWCKSPRTRRSPSLLGASEVPHRRSFCRPGGSLVHCNKNGVKTGSKKTSEL